MELASMGALFTQDQIVRVYNFPHDGKNLRSTYINISILFQKFLPYYITCLFVLNTKFVIVWSECSVLV